MMSDETVAMSYVIKDDAEAENTQASIWNTSVTEGSYMQPTTQRVQLFKAMTVIRKNILQPKLSGKQQHLLSSSSLCVFVWNATAAPSAKQFGLCCLIFRFDSTEMLSPGWPNESSQ